nr:MAG TPA: hypothetical protein [Caudoviricetes sp.]
MTQSQKLRIESKKGRKMGLLDKFKNKPFPEWMRKMKAEEQIEKERQAALDSMRNVPPLYDWSQVRQAPVLNNGKTLQEISRQIDRRCYNRFILRTSLRETTDPIRAELQNFIKNPLKLKLSAGLKRKLRREKAKYRQIREWMDDVEKAVNEAVFGDSGDER